MSGRSRPSRDKVRAHRERMRQRGLRSIQIWVPDVRSDDFAAEAHRQSIAVSTSVFAKDDQDFIEEISKQGGG
jgi:Antitoxin MazE-like